MSLAGQVALVSGGGRGIGREIALGLARDGMAVGLLGRRPQPLDEVTAEVTSAGGRALPVPADVTRTDEVRAAVDTVTRELGDVDLLVSNAGLRDAQPAPPWESDPDDWWQVVTTNLRGPFLLAHALLPAMLARGAGRILHLGSGMGHRSQPHGEWSAYAASKAALGRFTEALARATTGTGVVVLEASPGLVRTDMTETMWGPPDEQPWNPPEPVVELAVRFARGELDALHGRFVHATRDDIFTLPAAAEKIRAADARTLRLRPYGEDDPLA